MKHILIVEDDTILNETLSFNLQQKGYITQSAQNQKEALIKLKSVLFDAVLLDVSLPDGNGCLLYTSDSSMNCLPQICFLPFFFHIPIFLAGE